MARRSKGSAVDVGVANRGADLRKLAASLKASDRVIMTELRKGIRTAIRPMQNDAKARARKAPVKGTGHTGLRGRVAKTITTTVGVTPTRVYARLAASGKKMPSGQRSLPAMLEGTKPWRHPVYGNRNVWAQQSPHPYFDPAVKAGAPGVNRAIDAAIDKAASHIEKG